MAKKKKQKIKKHILRLDDEPVINDFDLIGIQTSSPLYKLIFDFNKQFSLGFKLDKEIVVFRKNKQVAFENYSTEENAIGQKMRILNNEILIPIKHPNTLFETHEAFYLFSELPSLNYLLMVHNDDQLNYQNIQKKFIASYPIRFVEVDLRNCATAFPVFPL